MSEPGVRRQVFSLVCSVSVARRPTPSLAARNQRDGELAAARAANRELMVGLNISRAT